MLPKSSGKPSLSWFTNFCLLQMPKACCCFQLCRWFECVPLSSAAWTQVPKLLCQAAVAQNGSVPLELSLFLRQQLWLPFRALLSKLSCLLERSHGTSWPPSLALTAPRPRTLCSPTVACTDSQEQPERWFQSWLQFFLSSEFWDATGNFQVVLTLF